MNKTLSMSIRVSKDELNAIRRAAELESYSSYSEYVRRTILLETNRILKKETDSIHQDYETGDITNGSN